MPYVAAFLLVLGLISGSGGARAGEPATMVVIFDGSGSMWGKPEGEAKTKLVLARDALKGALAKVTPETRVGLMSFGHRRGGDCSDTEVLVKPEAGTADKINGLLEKHNPRGKGPITAALREAAKELGSPSAPASVVLIHDDPDNCQLDPCSALGELRRAHPKVVVNVVTLGMKHEDAQKMMCLTQPTGGTLAEVANAQQANAALESIVKAATRAPPAGPGTPASADALRPAAGPAPPPAPPPGKPGLQLSATLVANGPVIEGPLRWRVLPAGQAAAPPLYEADAAAPFVELPAGRYDVEAQYGFVVSRTTVDVTAGDQRTVTLPLGAGTVKLTGAAAGGAMLRQAIVTFARTDAKGEPVAILRGVVPEVALMPGAYQIGVTSGAVRIERALTVAAGQRLALDPQLDLGEVELSAVPAAGAAPLEDAVFAVFEDDPDAPQGRREVARSAAREPVLTLPAGTYYAIARKGSAESRDRFTVRAGELVQRALVLEAARLTVSAKLPGRLETSEPVSLRLERLDDTRDVAQASRAPASFEVAAGRYRLETRVGSGNVRAERKIELKPGAREQATVEIPAGQVRLRLLETAGGPPVPDVGWEIREKTTGRLVWTQSATESRPLLLQGRYVVKAESRAQQVVREVEVKAGEARNLDIVGP